MTPVRKLLSVLRRVGWQWMFALGFVWGLTPQLGAADPWWTSQHGVDRNPLANVEFPAERVERRWEYFTGAKPTPAWYGPAKWDAYAELPNLRSMRDYDIVDHVALVDGRVYVNSTTHESVTCLRADDGQVVWRFFADGPVRIAPTVFEGRVYFGSDDGFAYCLSASTGELIWKVSPQPPSRKIVSDGRYVSMWPVRTGVLVADGKAYFAASLLPWKTTYLCAVDAATGQTTAPGCYVQQLHDVTLEGPLAATDKLLIAPQGRVAPLVFARQDGRALGELTGGGGSFVIVTPDQQIVHGPGNKQGWMTRSDPLTRAAVTSYKNANSLVVVGERTFMLADDRLEAHQVGQEQPVWSRELPGALVIAAARDTLLVGGIDRVDAISGDSGEVIWSHAVDGRVLGLAITDGLLVAGTDTGRQVAFRWSLTDSDAEVAAQAAANLPQRESSESPAKPAALDTRTAGVLPQVTVDPLPPGLLAQSPSLEFTGLTRAVVRWRTFHPVPTRLTWKMDDLEMFLGDEVPKTVHELELKELRPNRIYRYRIEVGGAGTERAGLRGDALNPVTPWYECDTFFNYSAAELTPLDNDPVIARTAELILSQSQVDRGLCVVWGLTDGKLAYELAARSRCKVIGLSTDAAQVGRIREWLMARGAYGNRVGVYHVASLEELPLTPFSANLIVSERYTAASVPPASLARMRRGLAPYGRVILGSWDAVEGVDAVEGGDAHAESQPTEGDARASAGSGAGGQAERSVAEPTENATAGTLLSDVWGEWRMWVGEPFANSGEWTHAYGRADNSAYGGESLANATTANDLDVQWLGQPGPRYQADRNGRKPPPLAVGGRLFLQGLRRLIALDAYNGSVLWSLEIPHMERYNMPRDSSNWAADEKFLYTAVGAHCWKIDVRNGQIVEQREVAPVADRDADWEWGYIAQSGDLMLGSSIKRAAAWREFWGKKAWYDEPTGDTTFPVCSDQLFAQYKNSPQQRWLYRRGLILNTSITIAGDKVYLIESRAADLIEGAERRVAAELLWKEAYLVALDLHSGQPVWEHRLETMPGKVASYLATDGERLALVTSADVKYHVVGLDAETGQQLWQQEFEWGKGKADHGSHLSRPAIVGDKLFVRPKVLDWKTGEPLAELSIPVGGCGTYACTTGALFFRSGSGHDFAIWDAKDGNYTKFGRLRPDCWLSTIPACGMLLSPEGGGGCSCGKWMETSMGFIPAVHLE